MVEVGQLLRDGQAEAGGVVLFVGGGMEVSVKDSALVFRRDAAAGVLLPVDIHRLRPTEVHSKYPHLYSRCR